MSTTISFSINIAVQSRDHSRFEERREFHRIGSASLDTARLSPNNDSRDDGQSRCIANQANETKLCSTNLPKRRCSTAHLSVKPGNSTHPSKTSSTTPTHATTSLLDPALVTRLTVYAQPILPQPTTYRVLLRLLASTCE